MINTSHNPFKKNITTTKKIIKYTHKKNISIKTKLNTINKQKNNIITNNIIYTDPKKYQKLIKKTNINTLTPTLNSIHNPYKNKPKLKFKKIKKINLSTNLPLILHNNTNIPTKNIQKTIPFNTTKININTKNQITSTKTIHNILNNNKKIYDPHKYLKPTHKTIKKTIKNKIKKFNTSNHTK